MPTLEVNVKTPDGTNRQYIMVKVYGAEGFVEAEETPSSGTVSFTVDEGWYKITLEDMASNEYAIQFVGENGAGVPSWEQAGEFDVDGDLTVSARLSDDIQLYGRDVIGINWTWWKDVTDGGAILRLQPGEWRRPFSGDVTDPLHKHVLVGPYVSRAAAAAA